MLTSTSDIVGQLKEYFEGLLNPTSTSFVEEDMESGIQGLFVSVAPCTKTVVWQCLGVLSQ